MLDYSLIQIERIIFHDLPTPDDVITSPNLSQVESTLSENLRQFLQGKFRDALIDFPYDIVADESAKSEVPALLTEYLIGDCDGLVSLSQQLARTLFEEQPANASECLLAVAQCTIDRFHGLTVAKIERQEGLNIQSTQDEQGRRTFELQVLESLFFTGKTRLYKIAHFYVLDDNGPSLRGAIVDKQRGYTPRTEVANYFLHKFLGCKVARNPLSTTRDWFFSVKSFIDQEVEQAYEQTQYLFALQAEMRSNRDDLNSRRFAEEHLNTDMAQRFEDHMEGEGFDPSRSILKDASLVQKELSFLTVRFESGIKLLLNENSADEHVQMEPMADGGYRVTITDRVVDVQAKKL